MPRQDRQVKAVPPAGGKSVRTGGDPDSANSKLPVWSIKYFDHDGPWGRHLCDKDDALWACIFVKLRHYESRTWAEITQNKKRDHPVSVDGLTKEARKRLTDLGLDDIESLFRLRLDGTQRVWGIRDREVFRLLWWDPDHEICESHLRNT